MAREIILDTETTGLSPKNGDRIVEIGCVEAFDKIRGAGFYHQYINPQRSIPEEVVRVHGITEAFVADKPVFADIADAFLDFIADDILVAHNAPFDIGFINAELERCGKKALSSSRVIDTVKIARKKFPGAKASLDALCKRFNISLSAREKHGALLDAELLADVYLYLHGGPQTSMFDDADNAPVHNDNGVSSSRPNGAKRSRYQTSAIKIMPSPEEIDRHRAFMDSYIL